jgi:hypothetical protein
MVGFVSTDAEPNVVCENIGPRQRALRMRFAIGSFIAGDLLSLALILTHAAHAWRLTAFVPFAAAAIGLLEAQQRTCVLLAAKRARNMDDGEKPVTAPDFLRQIARQSRRVMVQGIAIGLLLTLALWLVP